MAGQPYRHQPSRRQHRALGNNIEYVELYNPTTAAITMGTNAGGSNVT